MTDEEHPAYGLVGVLVGRSGDGRWLVEVGEDPAVVIYLADDQIGVDRGER